MGRLPGDRMSPEELVMQQFALSLARIETKLDGLISDTGDHEVRIRGLESGSVTRAGMWKALTAMCAVSASASAMIALFVR